MLIFPHIISGNGSCDALHHSHSVCCDFFYFDDSNQSRPIFANFRWYYKFISLIVHGKHSTKLANCPFCTQDPTSNINIANKIQSKKENFFVCIFLFDSNHKFFVFIVHLFLALFTIYVAQKEYDIETEPKICAVKQKLVFFFFSLHCIDSMVLWPKWNHYLIHKFHKIIAIAFIWSNNVMLTVFKGWI